MASEFELDLEALREMAPPPGSVIGLDNIEQYEQLIDPEFADFVEKGLGHSKNRRNYILQTTCELCGCYQNTRR